MTERKSNELLREALSAWHGKDRVRQMVIEMGIDDATVDVEAIDHAMEFVREWLMFVDSKVVTEK